MKKLLFKIVLQETKQIRCDLKPTKKAGLEIWKGFAGLIVGLTLGIIVDLLIQMRKNTVEGFPLIPYLAAGFMAAYMI